MEQLIKQLSYWNDSLDKMTSRLEQESTRRRLRTYLSTDSTEELQHLEAAAALLQHQDIERMASLRNMIEQGRRSSEEPSGSSEIETAPSSVSSDFLLKTDQLQWQGIPYTTDQFRAVATYRQESVIVDWRCCQDDSWRRKNPVAFRRRTEDLTKILNSDLKPLNLSILHCVGYLDRNSNVTGYAFRLPPDTLPGQNPMTLHQLLTRTKKPSDIPDLGERFEIAKALISTVFEIHNLGWMHKNIQPKNILFWPKANTNEPNLIKPYLMGFDISRPNHPGEVSEKPFSTPEDDLYRHPDYKGPTPLSFRPSFDMYSLGVILFEIGLWRTVVSQSHRRTLRPSLPIDYLDPQFIEKVVMSGPVMELKRYTGVKYQDVVKACLNRGLDTFWQQPEEDQKEQLQVYLVHVQNNIVDTIARCSA